VKLRHPQTRVLAVVAVSLFFTSGCSSPPRASTKLADQEIGAVQRATRNYHRTIKSITIKGDLLMVSVDDQDWDALDPDVQDAIRDTALNAWAKTWKNHHPRQKGTLRVSVMGYFGDRLATASTTL